MDLSRKEHQAVAKAFTTILLSLGFLFCTVISFAETSWIDSLVVDEIGFDGAVTVAKIELDEDIGSVTVTIPYIDVYGKPKMGQGRIFIHKQAIEKGGKLPAFSQSHYEQNAKGAKKWCEKGWAVFTPHYGKGDGEYGADMPVGDSYNLARAIIQWIHRLPFIDRTRLHVTGGSAGGYMAMAMAADAFPVTSLAPDAPVVNWAYTLNHFEVNKTVSGFGKPDAVKESPLPVMCMVTGLTDSCYKIFGNDLAGDAWYHLSPISYLDRITCPVSMICATGDMLVPIGQFSAKHVYSIDRTLFPEGYVYDFAELTLNEASRKPFVDLLPENDLFVHVQERPADLHELTRANVLGEEKETSKPEVIDRPWSRDKQWSLVILDEGPPLPHSTHFRYTWRIPPDSFVDAHQEKILGMALLTQAKLDWLLRRYMGKLENTAVLADGQPAHRLNYTDLEQLDVVTGLLDYAQISEAHAARLFELYAKSELKPWGVSLTIQSLEMKRDELRAGLGLLDAR